MINVPGDQGTLVSLQDSSSAGTFVNHSTGPGDMSDGTMINHSTGTLVIFNKP